MSSRCCERPRIFLLRRQFFPVETSGVVKALARNAVCALQRCTFSFGEMEGLNGCIPCTGKSG
ncbi:hypothetical protein DV681_24335 [Salmonella enterica]|nr:hypothetical protein [Salmonella enterica]